MSTSEVVAPLPEAFAEAPADGVGADDEAGASDELGPSDVEVAEQPATTRTERSAIR